MIDLIIKAQSGDKDAAETLIKENDSLIRFLMKKHGISVFNEDIETIECTIAKLNEIKELFFEAKTTAEKKHLRRRAKQLLPESWLQMRTVDTNYEELRNIFLQRQHHLLDVEWTLVCDFIKSLPYAEELILHATKKGEQ